MLVNNVDDLRERIRNGFETIRRIPDIFERVQNSMLKHAVDVGVQSGHFEYFP